ncbi:MAG: TonB-dependent receptor [Bacteroidota bacterium]
MKLRSLFILYIVCFLTSVSGNAQNTITGTVTDGAKTPLVGVNIVVKGTQNGTVTDFNGDFEIRTAIPNPVLVFSMLGFEIKEVRASTSNLLIALEAKDETLDEVILVGSRNPNRSRTNTPVAVDVVGIQEVKNALPQTTLNDLLNYLVPSFNNNRQSASDGTEHIDPASLRGLGPDQVLVLINGKRRHTTSLVNNQSTFGNGSVGTDLSAIPTSAIERIEVLRDGASAQYGSDAIAGVINLVLKKRTGLEVSTTYGRTSRNDGETININLNYGKKIGNLGGFMNMSLEYNNRQKTNRSQNHNLVIFDQSDFGNFFAYDFSNDNARAIDDQLIADNGLTRDDFNFQVGDAAIRNAQGFLNLEIPTTSNAAFYASGGLNIRNGEGFGFRRLPSEIGNVVPELHPFGFQPSLRSRINDISFSAGYRFSLGNWNVDLSNTLGENSFRYTVTNSNNFALGVLSPTRFDAGGHRFFQNVVNLDIQHYYADIMNGLNIALGSEFRQEQYHIDAGESASYIDGGAQSFPGFSPVNVVDETRTSIAFYADLEADVSDELLIGLAGRYEDYSDFGSTINGKLSLRYEPSDIYALRGAISTGFRAPSLHQQFFNNIATDIVDGELLNSGTFRNDSEVARQLGIPELKEETSLNFSAGVILKPSNEWLITIDGYKIDIKDRIIYIPEIWAMILLVLPFPNFEICLDFTGLQPGDSLPMP